MSSRNLRAGHLDRDVRKAPDNHRRNGDDESAMTNPEIRQSPDYGPAPEQALNARAQQARTDRLALIAAGVTVVLWASAFVAIRSAGREFSPGALALGRLTCGLAVLVVLAWKQREGWPPR